MVEVFDTAAARCGLARRMLHCPDCGQALRPGRRGRERTIRELGGALLTVRPDRARCTGCGATHVVLDACLLPRRLHRGTGRPGPGCRRPRGVPWMPRVGRVARCVRVGRLIPPAAWRSADAGPSPRARSSITSFWAAQRWMWTRRPGGGGSRAARGWRDPAGGDLADSSLARPPGGPGCIDSAPRATPQADAASAAAKRALRGAPCCAERITGTSVPAWRRWHR